MYFLYRRVPALLIHEIDVSMSGIYNERLHHRKTNERWLGMWPGERRGGGLNTKAVCAKAGQVCVKHVGPHYGVECRLGGTPNSGRYWGGEVRLPWYSPLLCAVCGRVLYFGMLGRGAERGGWWGGKGER